MLNETKIDTIILKINSLVNLYAKIHNLQDYIDSEIIEYRAKDLDKNYMNMKIKHFKITKINFNRIILDRNNDEYPEIKKFVQTINDLVSNIEFELFFIKKFYPDYIIILNVIKMLCYSIPREIKKEDLKKLNKLYKKLWNQ